MKIAIAGAGYVGLSNALLLSQYNEVVAYDIDLHKVELLRNRVSPIVDVDVQNFLKNERLNFRATNDAREAFLGAEYVIISTPTNYDPETEYFDTSTVDSAIQEVIRVNAEAVIIIKSTIPVGFTDASRIKYPTAQIVFSPEFLREGKALYDNLYPSRIVIGERSERARKFANLLLQGARKSNIDVLFTDSREAESIKLFANSYLAMRVAFFNELDTYALANTLCVTDVVRGICLDPRIGDYYNNPSFGYGGYCLPKDTRQLLSNFRGVPQSLVTAIVESNTTRIRAIAQIVKSKGPKLVGAFRLAMKSGSDNFRDSSILKVIEEIGRQGIKVIIYEPEIPKNFLHGIEVTHDLTYLKTHCDLILANRQCDDLSDVSSKVFSRDIFGKDE